MAEDQLPFIPRDASRNPGWFTLRSVSPSVASQEPLDWRPHPLKPAFLWLNALACILLACVVCGLLYGVGSDRQALISGANAHLLSTYVPTLIATISLVIFRVTFYEAFRMLPYYRMADQKDTPTQGATSIKSVGGSFFPWTFASYRDDFFLKHCASLLLLVVGVLTAFKSVYLGSQQTDNGWLITVHAKAAYYLIAAYSTMAIFYIVMFLCTRNRSTGLKWNPASPIDFLALVWSTNAMAQISRLPMDYSKAWEVLPKEARWRIGYWRRTEYYANGTKKEERIVHGVGIVRNPPSDGTPACRSDNIAKFLYPPMSYPIYLSVFLTILLLFIGAGIFSIYKGMFVEGIDLSGKWLLMRSNVNGSGTSSNSTTIADITDGFMVAGGHVIPTTDSTTANIIFRAVPTFIASYFSTAFIGGLDIRLRDTTCYSELAKGPKPSNKSLSLDYPTRVSFLIPTMAVDNGHYRLAYVSFVAALAPLCPVFVSGLFIFERKSAEVLHLDISKTSFVVTVIYLFLFVAAIVVAWPRHTELLLRPMYSFADSVRPFTDSSLLNQVTVLDKAMNESTREKFRARVLLAGYLYQLGLMEGTCGRQHQGVDIVGKEGSSKLYRKMLSAQRLIAWKRGAGKEYYKIVGKQEGRLSPGAGGFSIGDLTRSAPVDPGRPPAGSSGVSLGDFVNMMSYGQRRPSPDPNAGGFRMGNIAKSVGAALGKGAVSSARDAVFSEILQDDD